MWWTDQRTDGPTATGVAVYPALLFTFVVFREQYLYSLYNCRTIAFFCHTFLVLSVQFDRIAIQFCTIGFFFQLYNNIRQNTTGLDTFIVFSSSFLSEVYSVFRSLFLPAFTTFFLRQLAAFIGNYCITVIHWYMYCSGAFLTDSIHIAFKLEFNQKDLHSSLFMDGNWIFFLVLD